MAAKKPTKALKSPKETKAATAPKKPRGRPKSEEPTKQKAVRLSLDLTAPIEQLAKEFGLDDSDIIRRLLRLSLRPVSSDKNLLFTAEASQPLA